MGLFFNWEKRAIFSNSLYKMKSRYIKDKLAIKEEKSLYKRKTRYIIEKTAILIKRSLLQGIFYSKNRGFSLPIYIFEVRR